MGSAVLCKSENIFLQLFTERSLQARMSIDLTGMQSDVHIYYMQQVESQKKFAFELWQRIRHECIFPLLFSRPESR